MAKMLCVLEHVNEDVRLGQLMCRAKEMTGSDLWKEVTMRHRMELALILRGVYA